MEKLEDWFQGNMMMIGGVVVAAVLVWLAIWYYRKNKFRFGGGAGIGLPTPALTV